MVGCRGRDDARRTDPCRWASARPLAPWSRPAVAPFAAPSGPAGGADRFLDFLADEALPLVERSFRTAPMRVLGRWRSVDAPEPHELEVRAAGDTVVVHDRVRFPQGEPFDADDPVVQVTDDGALEWGLPFFRGLAALLVLRATPVGGDTPVVRREPRGWLPRDPHFDARRVVRFVRVRDHARDHARDHVRDRDPAGR